MPRTQLLRGLALLATGSATAAATYLLLQLLGGALQLLQGLLDLGDTLSQAQRSISGRLGNSARGGGRDGGGRDGGRDNGGVRRHLGVLIYLVGVFLNRKIKRAF
jgi:hypothetical protein